MWQQMYTGIKFTHTAPKREDIDIRDIAHSLSLQCRFAGHCRCFWSVGQHSLLVLHILKSNYTTDPKVLIRGLLHDASEAYACDIPTPLKMQMPIYLEIEKKIQDVVEAALALPEIDERAKGQIKLADKVALASEAAVLFDNVKDWESIKGLYPIEIPTRILLRELTEKDFLEHYRELQYALCLMRGGSPEKP